MLERFARDWPVYLIIVGFIWFVIYIILLNWKEKKKIKEIKKEIKQ